MGRNLRTAGRRYRFAGSALLGWCAIVVAFVTMGCPPELAWIDAAVGVGAVGYLLLLRARAAAVVTCAAILAMGAGLGALNRHIESTTWLDVDHHPSSSWTEP